MASTAHSGLPEFVQYLQSKCGASMHNQQAAGSANNSSTTNRSPAGGLCGCQLLIALLQRRPGPKDIRLGIVLC